MSQTHSLRALDLRNLVLYIIMPIMHPPISKRIDECSITALLSRLDTDKDKNAFLAQIRISDYLWDLNALVSVGNSLTPWRNEYTIRSNHSKLEEIKKFIKENDPEAVVTYSDTPA
jgi:hypothetical protein